MTRQTLVLVVLLFAFPALLAAQRGGGGGHGGGGGGMHGGGGGMHGGGAGMHAGSGGHAGMHGGSHFSGGGIHDGHGHHDHHGAVVVAPFFPVFGFGYSPYYWGWDYPYGYGYSSYYDANDFTGKIKLDHVPDNGEVYVNGTYAGRAKDMKSFRLEPGTYNIEVRVEGRTQFAQQLYVVRGKTLHLDLANGEIRG